MADAPDAALAPFDAPRAFAEAPRAAAVGDETHLTALIDSNAKALSAKDELSGDPLTWSARNVRGGVVSLLLQREADVESKSFGGMRPLHHAAHSTASEDIVRELLAKKADPNAPDDSGNTPFHYACRRGVLSICTIMHAAKADVSYKNAAGLTPLHIACNSGQLSIVQFLLSHDADPNDADKQGNTALHVAARTGFKAIVSALISAGAKVSNNRAGKSPAQVASEPDIAKLCS